MTIFKIKAVEKKPAGSRKKLRALIAMLVVAAAAGLCAALAWMANEYGVDLWRYAIVFMKMP